VWKIKLRRTAASVEYTAASVVRCSHKTTTKCLWRARSYTPETEVNPPGLNPLGHNPVFCCRRTSWDRTRRVFLLKTDTNPYSWPYPTHEAGFWPEPTHEWQQTSGVIHPSIHPSMCLLAENVHRKITMLKMTMLNGIPNRRGRPSVKTSVLHRPNTKPKHWCIHNSATNQTINQSIYIYI